MCQNACPPTCWIKLQPLSANIPRGCRYRTTFNGRDLHRNHTLCGGHDDARPAPPSSGYRNTDLRGRNADPGVHPQAADRPGAGRVPTRLSGRIRPERDAYPPDMVRTPVYTSATIPNRSAAPSQALDRRRCEQSQEGPQLRLSNEATGFAAGQHIATSVTDTLAETPRRRNQARVTEASRTKITPCRPRSMP
jgi:hypothetical protein